MFDEIGVHDGVEKVVVHGVVDMRVLVVVAPDNMFSKSLPYTVGKGLTSACDK